MIYEEMTSGDETLYVGDHEFDGFVIWTRVWEPSIDDGIFNEFLELDEDPKARDAENSSTSLDLEKIVLHLRNLSPNIKWKIQYNGSDDYNVRWLEIAVPSEQTWEAELIIDKIKNNGSMFAFSNYEEFYPCLFDAGKNQRSEISSFIDVAKALMGFIYNDYSDYWDAPDKQIFILTNILVNLYKAGCELNQIQIDFTTPDITYESDYDERFALDMHDRFNSKERSNKAHVLLNADNDELFDLFETVEFIFVSMDYNFDEFNGLSAINKASVIKYWQIGFIGTGWGSAILEILPKLHELSYKLKYVR